MQKSVGGGSSLADNALKGADSRFRQRQVVDLQHRSGGLLALFDEMLAVKIDELVGRLEVVRRQGDGEHRDFCRQLGLHQTADHGLGDEVMAIDAAIDHQRGAHDGIIASAFASF